MNKKLKNLSFLLLVVFVSSFGFSAALEQTTEVEQELTPLQLEFGNQDLVTANDAGGGYMSTRDIIFVVIVVFAIIGLIAIL